MKSFFKKNKGTVIVVAAFILLFIIAFSMYRLFFPNIGKPMYGNRLDDIKNYEVTNEQKEKLVTDLQASDKVTKAECDIRGRLINVIVTVGNDVSKEDAKALAKSVLTSLEEDQKGYYDIQVFVQKEDESQNDFPIIGYKHHNNSDLIFTADRDVVKK